MRSRALEAVIYTPLVIGYFLHLQRYAAEPLFRLYNEVTVGYAILGTLLIVAQGVLLEALTSCLLRRIGLRH